MSPPDDAPPPPGAAPRGARGWRRVLRRAERSAAAREVRDFRRAHEQRRRQLPRAIVVGLLSGLVAVAFSRLLLTGDGWRRALIAVALERRGAWLLLPPLLGAAGAGAAVWMVRRFAPEAAGSGIPHLKAVTHDLRAMHWRRLLPVKFFGGVSAISAGLALGREGPTIQMGGAIGQMVSGWFRCTPRERRTLIAAGAGAGLAGAFNAPLAGLVFVLEEIQRDFAPAMFVTTLIAAVTADVVTRLLNGQLPVLHVAVHPVPPLLALPVALALGVVAGGFGILFNRALLAALDAFQALRGWPAWVGGGLAGLFAGCVGLIAPDVLGGGHRLVEETLSGDVSLARLLTVFPLRFALTATSYGCGAPGGIFAPLLVLGSQLGLAAGWLAQWTLPGAFDHPETFAVVGMAAYFAAIVRAPLTGIVLMVELTGDYALVLPLLVASLTAYGIADYLRDRPIYEALLERDLLRGGDGPPLEATLLLELTVAPNAPFVGRTVQSLGLPSGCVLVTVRRGLREVVPGADWQLDAGDHITAVIDAQARDAIVRLRRGTGALAD
ncbi:MAG: H(+)/Cl(-) exchange transporter ClcA [Deltaproteobacteria bacterium]|nr:H(+)/Cl(-) exchange transporter ClcA [Deltaproteobacteria bacterium]